MIINNDFIFVHIHKTGGTWIKQGISQSPPHRNKVRIAPHAPIGIVPQEYEHLPAWGIVRNPWDWYVSWFEFSRGHIQNRTSIFAVEPSQFTRSHHESMYLVRTFEAFIKEGPGFSREVQMMTEHPRMRVTLHRFEDGLDTVLTQYVPTAKMNPKPVNASKRGPYHNYYTDELREIVAERDKNLIKEFNYSYESYYSSCR